MKVDLIPFPANPSGPAGRVRVELDRDGASLRLRYVVEGDIDRIEWPEAAEPGRADELWKHTCFEAFLRTADGYGEFNLSPSGRWASYGFGGYREGMRNADEAAVVLGLDAGANHAALEARVELPPGADRLALSAVIEDVDGGLTYWALAHPSPFPDFHHSDSFALDLP